MEEHIRTISSNDPNINPLLVTVDQAINKCKINKNNDYEIIKEKIREVLMIY